MRLYNSNVVLHFRSLGDVRKAMNFVDALDWLCKAVRRPSPNETKISFALYECQLGERMSSKRSLHVHSRLSSTHPPLVEHYCWEKLFQSWTLVTSSLTPRAEFEKGLEMSFDLMLSMASAELQTVVAGGIVFVGYHTILYPTAIHETSAQFHLLMEEKGQINPNIQQYGSRVLTEDATQFRRMRCFLGWCTNAQVNLGTERLPISIKYSGAAEKGRSIQLDGYAAVMQAGASAPLSAILGVQTNFKYLSHQLRFTPTSNYIQLLEDTAREVALVYDSSERRCWLVPKLSLLLHMSHAYSSHCGFPRDRIPLVEPHSDAVEIVRRLEAFGGTPIFGGGEDVFRFRQLILGLNTNLLRTVDLVKPSGSRKLYGFEFMDIISQPGRGSCMKELNIGLAGKSWLEFANTVDAVVVCASLGDAITAADEARLRNKQCAEVPHDFDYLAATISCLKRLLERRGGALDSAVGAQPLQISDDSFWELLKSPFGPCNHNNCPGACWENADIYQHLISQPVKLHNLRRKLNKPRPASSALQIPVLGAVVFGTPPRNKKS